MIISIIVAVANNRVIGGNNKLLWHLSEDLKRFKSLTMGHHILMGRKTFESIGRPLPGRKIIVVSRKNLNIEGVDLVTSVEEGIKIAEERGEKELFICGGGEIYKETISFAQKLYITELDLDIDGDTYFPKIQNWSILSEENPEFDKKSGLKYQFKILKK